MGGEEKTREKQSRNNSAGTSLVAQWLRLCAPKGEGPGSIPGQGTKIPQATSKSFHALTKRSCMTQQRLKIPVLQLRPTQPNKYIF